MKYPYALTGGFIVLGATVAAALVFLFPFAELTVEGDGSGEQATQEYYAAEMRITDGQDGQTMTYGDKRFDDGRGIGALRTGNYLLLGGLALTFSAAMALFAAPGGGGVKAARGGAWAGLVGGAVLVAAVAFYLVGYMDQVRGWAELDSEAFTMTGNRIVAGTYFLGLGAVLAFGGGVLGFSDKVPLVAHAARPSCPSCGAGIVAGTRFCAACGAAVAAA